MVGETHFAPFPAGGITGAVEVQGNADDLEIAEYLTSGFMSYFWMKRSID